jgi:hypothetical protein
MAKNTINSFKKSRKNPNNLKVTGRISKNN